MPKIREKLLALQDLGYRDLAMGLIPAVDRDMIIGVRTPDIRRLAKALRGTEEAAVFLQELPHAYYDENNLHAALIAEIRDFDACIAALDAFLPFVDNWATCDMMSPPCLGKRREALLPHIRCWMASNHTYICRFGMGMLMRWFLDDAFDPIYLDWVAAVRSEEYYVNMMIAWYFATALAKQYDAALPYITARRLDLWTHNKAIQKACESYRVTEAHKTELKALKITTKKRD